MFYFSNAYEQITSVAKCRGSWVVGKGRGSWVWVWVNVVGKNKKNKERTKGRKKLSTARIVSIKYSHTDRSL